jgi:hypothetical protein
MRTSPLIVVCNTKFIAAMFYDLFPRNISVTATKWKAKYSIPASAMFLAYVIQKLLEIISSIAIFQNLGGSSVNVVFNIQTATILDDCARKENV